MDSNLLFFLLVALGAALCSPLGGVIAIAARPSSLMLSLSVGFAGGALLGAVTLEMVPKALALAALPATLGGIVVGVLVVWGFDLYVNRGVTAGEKAAERPFVHRYHRRHRPHGGKVTVIAGATTAEELIEGVVIGVSGIVGGGTGLVVGLAIAINNISEAMSIGQLVREEKGKGDPRRAILGWTATIGAALLASALAGYFLLGGLPPFWQGVLTAIGAGAMFYIATTGLVPEAESHQFEQSGGLATAAGLLAMVALTELGRG